MQWNNPLDPWHDHKLWWRSLWPAERWMCILLAVITVVALLLWATHTPKDRNQSKNIIIIKCNPDRNKLCR